MRWSPPDVATQAGHLIASPATRATVIPMPGPLHLHHRFMLTRGLTPGSIEARMSVLRRCEQAIGRPLIGATAGELAAWADNANVTPRTRYTYLSHLSCFYRWAINEDLTTVDPTVRIATR